VQTPFVIARAATTNPFMVVVTEESAGKTRIPDVCAAERIQCCGLADLIEREDWRWEMARLMPLDYAAVSVATTIRRTSPTFRHIAKRQRPYLPASLNDLRIDTDRDKMTFSIAQFGKKGRRDAGGWPVLRQPFEHSLSNPCGLANDDVDRWTRIVCSLRQPSRPSA
jgi:hypothetical protein